MGKLVTTLEITKRSAGGKILIARQQPSRSWVIGMLSLLYLHAGNGLGVTTTLPDITNTSRTLAALNSQSISDTLRVNSHAGDGTEIYNIYSATQNLYTRQPAYNCGIVVGTGVVAAAPGDYALGTPIISGGGAGQLYYGGTEVFAVTIANPNGSFAIRRYFTNSSGGSITVNECGIYTVGYVTSEYPYAFCICRDLTGGVVVADTEILAVTYTVQITV